MGDIFGWMGSICFAVGGIPQVWKCFKEKHAHGLSGLFLASWIAGEVFFIASSLMKFGWVSWIMFNCFLGLLCSLVITYYKLFSSPRKVIDYYLNQYIATNRQLKKWVEVPKEERPFGIKFWLNGRFKDRVNEVDNAV